MNECLKVSEMEPEPKDREVRLATPPSDKLISITTNMNTNLTSLLAILQVKHDMSLSFIVLASIFSLGPRRGEADDEKRTVGQSRANEVIYNRLSQRFKHLQVDDAIREN